MAALISVAFIFMKQTLAILDDLILTVQYDPPVNLPSHQYIYIKPRPLKLPHFSTSAQYLKNKNKNTFFSPKQNPVLFFFFWVLKPDTFIFKINKT